MQFVSIHGRRDAYDADELENETLTVGELIEVLSEYDDDTPVLINNDDGYTYGVITNWSIKFQG